MNPERKVTRENAPPAPSIAGSPGTNRNLFQRFGGPPWKSAIRRWPGAVPLYRAYLNAREQYSYLSRIARERYGRAESLFDAYQEDYSPNAGAEQERYELILDALAKINCHWGDAIEIGCSKGFFTARLAEACRSVLACDISPRACEITSRRCAEFANVKVQCLDIKKCGVTGAYDLVFVMDILAYVHGRCVLEQVIDNLSSLVKPDGLLVFSDVRWPESITRAWWQRWMPEGADRQLEVFSARKDLSLLRRFYHENSSNPEYSYMDHLIAILRKLVPRSFPAGDRDQANITARLGCE